MVFEQPCDREHSLNEWHVFLVYPRSLKRLAEEMSAFALGGGAFIANIRYVGRFKCDGAKVLEHRKVP